MLKEESKLLSAGTLIEFVSEISQDLEITPETENAMAAYFNTGRLNTENRKVLENCYVLLKNFLCIAEDGEICQTLMVGKK